MSERVIIQLCPACQEIWIRGFHIREVKSVIIKSGETNLAVNFYETKTDPDKIGIHFVGKVTRQGDGICGSPDKLDKIHMFCSPSFKEFCYTFGFYIASIVPDTNRKQRKNIQNIFKELAKKTKFNIY